MALCEQCGDHEATICVDCRGEWVDRALRYERLVHLLRSQVRYLEMKLEDTGVPFSSLIEQELYAAVA